MAWTGGGFHAGVRDPAHVGHRWHARWNAYGEASTAFVVQPRPGGLCDAIFRAGVVLNDNEPVLVGLPDTIWFPKAALAELPDDELSFLLFPVEQPQLFDAVVLDGDRVCEIQVKQQRPDSNWIWGAFKMPGTTFRDLRWLWEERGREDEYFGTLVNAYLESGGTARGICAGEAYVDVGTLHGYRTAMSYLADASEREVEGSRFAQMRGIVPATS